MDAGEKMDDRYKKLLEEGKALGEDFLKDYRRYRYAGGSAAYTRWKKDCLELVKASFGEKSAYYSRLVTAAKGCSPLVPGTVLEDVLRRLCKAHGVFCAENVTLEALNDKLFKAGVYDAAWHSETSQRIGLRRTAELCYTDKINSRNVLDMIGWLRLFMPGRFAPGGSRAKSAVSWRG